MLIIRPGSVTSNSVVKHVKPKFLASPPTSTVVYLVCSQVMGSNLNPQLVSTEILSQDLPTSVIPPTSPSTSWHRFPGQGFSKIRPADFICKRAVWLILKKKSKKNTFIGIWHLPSSPPPGHPELFKGHNDTFLPPDSCICTCRDHLGCSDQSLRASVKAISTLSREKYQLVNTADTVLNWSFENPDGSQPYLPRVIWICCLSRRMCMNQDTKALYYSPQEAKNLHKAVWPGFSQCTGHRTPQTRRLCWQRNKSEN